MSNNWIAGNIQKALDVWNGRVEEIWRLLSVSPEEFGDGRIWEIMMKINGALKAVGYALLTLFFLYGAAVKFGSVDELKSPSRAFRLFLRFILAKAAITWGPDLMTGMYSFVQGVTLKVVGVSGVGKGEPLSLPSSVIEKIEDCGFGESIPLWFVTLIGSLLIWILSFVLILTVYGRFFRLYLHIALSPLPLAAFASEQSSGIAKNFVKSYCGVCLEGAVIALCCVIYSVFSTSVPSVDMSAGAATVVWTYAGELIFNMLVLVGTVKLADRAVTKMTGM